MSEVPPVEPIDTLIEPRWILPIRPRGVLLEGHAIAVEAGTIRAVLPAAEAGRRFAARATVRLQQGPDLGARMSNAFAATLDGARPMLLIGTDCPAQTGADLAARAAAYVETTHPHVDVAVYDGGQERYPLLVSVE